MLVKEEHCESVADKIRCSFLTLSDASTSPKPPRSRVRVRTREKADTPTLPLLPPFLAMRHLSGEGGAYVWKPPAAGIWYATMYSCRLAELDSRSLSQNTEEQEPQANPKSDSRRQLAYGSRSFLSRSCYV